MIRVFRNAQWLKRSLAALVVLAGFLFLVEAAGAQGVTTGSIIGIVLDAQKRPVAGAEVVAIHTPSGTSYQTLTTADGRFIITAMRVGGPYSVVVAPVAGGGTATFQAMTQDNVMVNLGVATDLSFSVKTVVTEAVTVVGVSDPVFSSQRTGAATTITRDLLATLPTIGGRLNDMTRLTPQYGGNLSFGGMDSRLNHITVDGSSFNNSFGLRNTPGDSSGVAPISLAAIEQVQVSLAPYDVRQGNFVGAAVNTVTRSGGNQLKGSFYHTFRDNSVVGTRAKASAVNPGTFNFRNTGGWASGPIQKNRTFFFGSYEDESFVQPGTTFRAREANETAGGSVTRVLRTDLEALSAFMKANFNYDTGGFQGYDFNTPAKRFIAKLDHNFNDRNKLVVRYNQLDSSSDILVSNSNSLGFGDRRTSLFGLNFQNSNYAMLENIRSIVGEWNSVLGTRMANNLIMGWTSQDESRSIADDPLFPFIDILEAERVYTSLGFEPFSPNNELRYKTFQIQNNLSWFRGKHNFTFGYAAEFYRSENVFNSGAQSVYVYNSLADFYADANGYLANPNRTTSPITLREFEVRYNNIPGQTKPIQPLEVFFSGGYVQDDWRVKNNLTIAAGLRIDIPVFGDTAFTNVNADALTWRDENGNPTKYNTGDLPPANPLWSPRVGFNWDVRGDRNTQLRGGTGVFTGRPAYVWISNQVGNTGVLTGTDFNQFNRTDRPFHPDPNRYKPTNITGAPAASYNLELIHPDFKFPQVWRSNIGLDHRFAGGWTGTLEYIYNRDVNGLYYTNENLPASQATYVGADTRPRWTSNRINNVPGNQVSTAVVLKNQNIGRAWNWAGTLEKKFVAGLWFKTAYSYGESKNTVDPGSIATGSWQNNAQRGDPNNPPIAFSSNSPGHRWFAVGSFSRDFFKFGATTVSLFWESRTIGNASYVFASDANGDSGNANDLLYVHRDQSEMNFVQFNSTFNGVTTIMTPAMQAAAWDAYIAQDPYLSTRRGQYAERGAVFLPFVHRADFSVSQDFAFNAGGRRHTFQFRWDVDNFTNLLNSDWGVSQRLVSNSPLTNPGVDAATGRMTYRLRVVNGQLMSKSYEQTAGLADVYRMMFSLKYMF
jgi:hypothetical protein